MALARLLVERGSLRAKSEDWGEYRFLALPSPGDRVAVRRGNEHQYLTVISVHHRPVATDQGGDAEPLASVVAKWTGSD